MSKNTEWWRGAVIYQIYPRSFMDLNGDGIGDLPGIERRLDYVASLGVDAVWISPFFKSPMKDFGYDISDYYEVDPIFGHINDFKRILKHAHDLNLKVIIDEVWSHTSDQHVWFYESRMNRENPKHDWYVWADPKPDGGPPNNWLSYFGGPAWTWDSRREQYYLHHYLSSQPTLDLWVPAVREAIFDVAKYWLDMGVDGFRLDAIHTCMHDPELRDNPVRMPDDIVPMDVPSSNPMSYQKRVYSMGTENCYTWAKLLRSFINEHYPHCCLLGEAAGDDSEGIAAAFVQGNDKLHMAYSFGLLGSHMSRDDVLNTLKRIEDKIGDGWICWATSNHDTIRAISRMQAPEHLQKDAALLVSTLGLSLRGSYCMYQGEELGLPQAKLSFEDLRDPYDIALYPNHAGRDGGRTPMPWHPTKPNGGFSFANETWIKFWDEHRPLSVEVQENDPHSVLNRIRNFIGFRNHIPALHDGEIQIVDLADPFVGWIRSKDNYKVLCLFNLSPNEACWTIPNSEDYSILSNISHGINFDDNKETLSFSPYGFAFLGYMQL